jgi:hypothetical protein
MAEVGKEKLTSFKLKSFSNKTRKFVRGLDGNLQFQVYVLMVVKE